MTTITITRCPTGQQLWQTIDAALETHDLEIIYAALRAYFTHKSGVTSKTGLYKTPPCPDCQRARRALLYG